jgi:hypothetical protein
MRARRKTGFIALLAFTLLATASFAQNSAAVDSPSKIVEMASINSSDSSLLRLASAEASIAASPATAAALPAPVAYIATPKPSTVKLTESERQKKIWYALTIANHSAVAFDAYSTRYAVSRGARELNPMLKPFASSGWIYPAMQVGALGLDYVSHKMMRSKNPILRKMWWLPQSANAASSFAAGIHNMNVR